jgi:hypothetical protein
MELTRYTTISRGIHDVDPDGTWVRYADLAPLLAERELLLGLLEAAREWRRMGNKDAALMMQAEDGLEAGIDACMGIER